MSNKEKGLLGFAGVTSLIAVILGIVAISKKVMMGAASLFDGQWANMPSQMDVMSNHRNAILGLGFVALIIGLLVLAGTIFVAYKMNAGSSFKINILIGLAVLALIVLIFGSIAMSFNADLNSVTWFAKQIGNLAGSGLGLGF